MKYLSEIPIIGIIRGADTREVEGATAAAVRGGFRVLEITLSRPEAFDQIAAEKARFADQIELGAGTVLDVGSAQKAIDSGAQFIVSPVLIPEIIEFCRSRSVPVFPGALTPTEVFAAFRAGAEMVKVFPVSSVGPGYMKSLKGPFPEIRLLPTGGIAVASAAEYFKAGADAIGVGGELFRKEWLAQGDWAAIEETARAYIKAVRETR